MILMQPAGSVYRSSFDEQDESEVERIFRLTDQFLGHYLLGLARGLRREHPVNVGSLRPGRGYEAWLAWAVIPEIARRLGVDDPDLPAGTAPDIARASSRKLRHMAGRCLTRAGLLSPSTDPAVAPYSRLASRKIQSGNPIAIALDRVAPPEPGQIDPRDILAIHLQAAQAAKGISGLPVWQPAGVRAIPAGPDWRSGGRRDDRITDLSDWLDAPHGPFAVLQSAMERRRQQSPTQEASDGLDDLHGPLDLPI